MAVGCKNGSPTAPEQPKVYFIFIAGDTPGLPTTVQFDAVSVTTSGVTRVISPEAAWTSSNPAVASVSPTGQVTAVSTGTAVIGATYQGFADDTEVTGTFFPCLLTAQPAQISVPASGGSVVITIGMPHGFPACSWAARARDPFLTIVGPSSGTGAGSITVSITPNAGPPRTGFLTVARKLITVSQN